VRIKLQDEIYHCVCDCGEKYTVTFSAGSVWSYDQYNLKNECCEASASTAMQMLMHKNQIWEWYKDQVGLHYRTAELFKHNDIEKTLRTLKKH